MLEWSFVRHNNCVILLNNGYKNKSTRFLFDPLKIQVNYYLHNHIHLQKFIISSHDIIWMIFQQYFFKVLVFKHDKKCFPSVRNVHYVNAIDVVSSPPPPLSPTNHSLFFFVNLNIKKTRVVPETSSLCRPERDVKLCSIPDQLFVCILKKKIRTHNGSSLSF